MHRLYRLIDFFHYDVPYGIRNLIAWLPLVWRDRDWDWECLASIMEFKLRRMSKHSSTYAHHIGSSKDARDMLICAEILRRLIDDEMHGPITRANINIDMNNKRDLQKLMGKIIGAKMRGWWD